MRAVAYPLRLRATRTYAARRARAGRVREQETTVLIRPERPDDVDAIDRLTVDAFEPQSFSDGSEAPIIRSLRASGDLTLSLVAEDEGDVVGHVAFSPVTIDGSHDGWFGLGPISVRIDRNGGVSVGRSWPRVCAGCGPARRGGVR